MQIKSLNKRLKLSSSSSSSDHSRTLAGFQKYVEDLVDAYQRGASSGLQQGTVDLIRDYLTQLWSTFRSEHNRDKKIRDWCGNPGVDTDGDGNHDILDFNIAELCDGCVAADDAGDYCTACAQAKGLSADCSSFSTNVQTAVSESLGNLTAKRQAHESCREGRYGDCTNEACRYWDKYRLTQTWKWAKSPSTSVDFSFTKCTSAFTTAVLVGGHRGQLWGQKLLHQDVALTPNENMAELNDLNYGVVSTTWFPHWDSHEANVVGHKRRATMLPLGWTHHGNDEVHDHEVCSVQTNNVPFLPSCVKAGHVDSTHMQGARQSNGEVADISNTSRQVAIGTGITPGANLVIFEKCLVAIRAWLGPRTSCYSESDGDDPYQHTILVPNSGSADSEWAACKAQPGSKDSTTIPGLWPLFKACRLHRIATEQKGAATQVSGGATPCNTYQRQFQEAHCNHYQLTGYHCYEMNECIRTETTACGTTAFTGFSAAAAYANGEMGTAAADVKNISNASGTGFKDSHTVTSGGTGTCGQIQERVEQRQSDNETMEHIDCLLAALISATSDMGASTDATLKEADAERNANSERFSFRCTASSSAAFTDTSNGDVTEGEECVCTGPSTNQASVSGCTVAGNAVDDGGCACTEFANSGRSDGTELKLAEWNKLRANATMRFCRGENYRKRYVDKSTTQGIMTNGGSTLEYSAGGLEESTNTLTTVTTASDYNVDLQIAGKYDYWTTQVTGSVNFKMELVKKWSAWLIPCAPICTCTCPDTPENPPCTEEFKDEYYNLHDTGGKGFSITLGDSTLITESADWGGTDGTHVPERHGTDIFEVPSNPSAWMDLNSPLQIPRTFETDDAKSGTKNSTWNETGDLTVSATIHVRSGGYEIWNRAACWDVEMCDVTDPTTLSGGSAAAKGKCHSYYTWSSGVTTGSGMTVATSQNTVIDAFHKKGDVAVNGVDTSYTNDANEGSVGVSAVTTSTYALTDSAVEVSSDLTTEELAAQ